MLEFADFKNIYMDIVQCTGRGGVKALGEYTAKDAFF